MNMFYLKIKNLIYNIVNIKQTNAKSKWKYIYVICFPAYL